MSRGWQGVHWGAGRKCAFRVQQGYWGIRGLVWGVEGIKGPSGDVGVHWGLAGSVGAQGVIGSVGASRGCWGHQEVLRVSGVHWGAGRECRGSWASRGIGDL